MSGTEVVVESASAPDEPPQSCMPPAGSEPCGRTPADINVENCGSMLGRKDSTLTEAERQWLARYPCISRQQLAELREAFLMFAVNAPPMTPRTAATVAESARLDVADVGTCLRAVGQNPTQADVTRITAIPASQQQQQQQQPEDGGGLTSSNQAFAAAASSNRAIFPAASKQQPVAGAGAGASRLMTVVSDYAASSRPSGSQSPTTAVSLQQITYVM